MADALPGAAAPLHEAALACPQLPFPLVPQGLPPGGSGCPCKAAHAGRCARAGHPHGLRRLVRSIVLRAALHGRLSWHLALPVMAKLDGGVQ